MVGRREMKVLRGLCAVAWLVSSFYQSGTLTCGRTLAHHPVCPMHTSTGGTGGAAHLESASDDPCHDSASQAHCVPGQLCSASVPALAPGVVSAQNGHQVRLAGWAAAPRWLSYVAGRTGPPPRPSIRIA